MELMWELCNGMFWPPEGAINSLTRKQQTSGDTSAAGKDRDRGVNWEKECWGRVTLMAMLLDSVAPLVKMISLGSAPIKSATCCSESKTTHRSRFNHIPITKKLTKPFRKNNKPVVPFIQTKSLYLPCRLHGGLTLPAIGMCSGVRVTVVVNLVGQHGVQHTWILRMRAHIKQ